MQQQQKMMVNGQIGFWQNLFMQWLWNNVLFFSSGFMAARKHYIILVTAYYYSCTFSVSLIIDHITAVTKKTTKNNKWLSKFRWYLANHTFFFMKVQMISSQSHILFLFIGLGLYLGEQFSRWNLWAAAQHLQAHTALFFSGLKGKWADQTSSLRNWWFRPVT